MKKAINISIFIFLSLISIRLSVQAQGQYSFLIMNQAGDSIKLASIQEFKAIDVLVKNIHNIPISGATILVKPGKSSVTDASGFGQAFHHQIIGEWVIINVSAEGYKTQEQKISASDVYQFQGDQKIPTANGTLVFMLE
ncbi:MAG: carboxypeptidase-like regulatory domain-containing protein [Bacteroidota bacterium]|nr:carboxypeptidase-like regulatory domain-containing protein [Bacteroidota bacterium]